jgi:hypothetical protein
MLTGFFSGLHEACPNSTSNSDAKKTSREENRPARSSEISI